MKQIHDLMQGFGRFQKKYVHNNSDFFSRLAQGQTPRVMVIGCSDSRVAPALLLDCSPGDIFVVRNIANLVPPYKPDEHCHGVSAALEYGVKSLQVEHIIVLGHSQCGGIRQLMTVQKKREYTEFVDNWMSIVQPACEEIIQGLPHASFEEQCLACEQKALLVSLKNLQSFPWIQHRIAQGKLTLHGWYFDLKSGELFQHDHNIDDFVRLEI